MEFIYCAFCKHGRKAYTKKHMSFRDYLYALILSCLAMLVFFQEFHPSVFFIFFAMVFIVELFFQLRRRVSIQCDLCGFDPVLYTKSPMLAEKKVQEVLQQKKDSLDYLLKPNNPFEHLKPRSQQQKKSIKFDDSSRL